MVYIRDGIIAKRLENLEGKHSETICLELTVSKKKWFITFAYAPPSGDNKAIFLNDLTTSLSQITNWYVFFVVMGDLSIDTPGKDTKIHHVTYLIFLTPFFEKHYNCRKAQGSDLQLY